MKFYKIKVGNMYLSYLVVDCEDVNNEFISYISFDTKKFVTFSNKESAEGTANKIYIVLGIKCKVVEANEDKN